MMKQKMGCHGIIPTRPSPGPWTWIRLLCHRSQPIARTSDELGSRLEPRQAKHFNSRVAKTRASVDTSRLVSDR